MRDIEGHAVVKDHAEMFVIVQDTPPGSNRVSLKTCRELVGTPASISHLASDKALALAAGLISAVATGLGTNEFAEVIELLERRSAEMHIDRLRARLSDAERNLAAGGLRPPTATSPIHSG